MPVRARQWLRRLRGGAQAHLIEADDGHFYVLKAKNNPQHRRILVNEWLSSVFLEYLQITAPTCRIIEVTKDFVAANPEFSIQLGHKSIPIETGWHFGSRYPGDPEKLTIWDNFPDVLLAKVANLADFRAILPFDKWCGNADARQSIFYKAQLRQRRDDPVSRTTYVTSMIDHGFVLDGPNWNFMDSPLQGLYYRHFVYRNVRSLDDFEPWLTRVVNFPEEVIDQAYKQIPREWLPDGDDQLLEQLLEKLMDRRTRVPHLIEDVAINARNKPFPSWKT